MQLGSWFRAIQGVWFGSPGAGAVRLQHVVFPGRTGVWFPGDSGGRTALSWAVQVMEFLPRRWPGQGSAGHRFRYLNWRVSRAAGGPVSGSRRSSSARPSLTAWILGHVRSRRFLFSALEAVFSRFPGEGGFRLRG